MFCKKLMHLPYSDVITKICDGNIYLCKIRLEFLYEFSSNFSALCMKKLFIAFVISFSLVKVVLFCLK